MANDVLDAGEILKDDAADRALKQELDNLAKDINVKESSLDKVDALFSKLDSVDVEAKNRALQYALKNAKITVGNVEKSIAEISTIFNRATEQEGSTWRIKVKEGAQQDDKDLVGGFLNEKGSSLAYLIQLSSRNASLQASRGYGRSNADGLVDVGVDKIFGNQTRRALSGLKEWIQGDYTKNVESLDVKAFTVDNVLNLKFISKSLKEKIEKEAEDENVKNLWNNGDYELKNKYTNNYALKKKGTQNSEQQEDEERVPSNDNEQTKETPEFTSDNITKEEMQSYVDTIKAQCENELKISNEESLGLSFDGKNLVFTLGGTGLQQVDYVSTTSYGHATYNTSEYLITEKVDVKTCLKGGDPENGEYGNIDVEYVKMGVIRRVKENIVNKKKAIRGSQELVKKYKKDGFTMEDVFGGDPVLQNNRKKGRINTFFNKFKSQKLVLDKDTTYYEDNIRLEFDDMRLNEDYNKWKNNSDLEFKASEIVKNDYSVDESKFKKKLKTIILNIIEREDFK